MRLTQIKLAGFKSFVDPTTIATPGQLVGIVGPNGCGKSNVIDAVRWVLGESKASALRGESMQDVIFNGAGERKPVGRASVELHFDNSLGRIGGQWGQYAEISIKRVLTRDGDSSYYINNIPVRRRDIHDLFLGTGLGPRAYAIIEQGMISRVIEAKPEELRIFLEEAAGVSKYKERRKETEGRLADTRENLARVEDIRIELGNQLTRLDQQAQVATQYRELEARLRTSQHLMWFAKQQDAVRARERCATEIAALTVALEAIQAEMRAAEARLEALRADHYAAGDALHEKQGAFYAANAEVTRLEQQLAFARESETRITQQVAQLTEALGALAGQETALADDRATADAALEAALTAREAAAAEEAAAHAALPALEADVATASAALAELQQQIAQTEQGIRVAEARRDSATQALGKLADRRDAPRRGTGDDRRARDGRRARDRGAAARGERRPGRQAAGARGAAGERRGPAGTAADDRRRLGAGEPPARRSRGARAGAVRAAGEDRPRHRHRRLAGRPWAHARAPPLAAGRHRAGLGGRARGRAARTPERDRARAALRTWPRGSPTGRRRRAGWPPTRWRPRATRPTPGRTRCWRRCA